MKSSNFLLKMSKVGGLQLSREIKETDNLVRALYEARKIESKLAQRKLLGIVTPIAVSVEATRKRANLIFIITANFVDILMTKVNAPHLEKFAIYMVVRITLNLSVNLGQKGPMDLSQWHDSKKGQMKPEKINACTDAVYIKSMKMSVMRTAQWRT